MTSTTTMTCNHQSQEALPLQSMTVPAHQMNQHQMGEANDERPQLLQLDLEDLSIGKLLGKGSFGTVYAVDMCRQDQNAVARSSLRESSASFSRMQALILSSFLESVTTQDMTEGEEEEPRPVVELTPTYALKRLRYGLFSSPSKAIRDSQQQKMAFEDLLFEKQILSQLPLHENIVQLLGVSKDFINPEDCFLVMERVQETLQDRLDHQWNPKYYQNSRNSLPFCTPKKQLLRECHQRLEQCAVGLTRALAHLHKHQIIYRDMKPSNVGFATDGTVRLFDFGLARECSVFAPSQNDTEGLCGSTGTPRYMSPECALSEDPAQTIRYGLSADIYSAALLIWQLCTLKKPYHMCRDLSEWHDMAVVQRQTPAVKRNIVAQWPAVKGLLQECWHAEPAQRPTAAQLCRALELALVSAAPLGKKKYCVKNKKL